MANIQIIDKGTKNERYKVMYDVTPGPLQKRKRRAKTFPVGTPLKEVKRFLREVETERDKGIYVDYSKRTLDVFAEEYFEQYGEFISPTTLENYKQMYYTKKNGIKKYLGNIKLENLDTADVQAYVKVLMDDGRSPKTIKNRIMFLHAMLEKAMKLNYIRRGYNPAEGCDLPKVVTKQVDVYTVDEVRQLLAAANLQSNLNIKLIINLLVGSGIRKSELCSLKHDSFDFTNGTVKIDTARVSAQGKIYLKETKSQSGTRTIPLPISVIELVKQSIADYKKRKLKYGSDFIDSCYLLTTKYGKPLTPDGVYNLYRNFMTKQPELRYLPMHKIRHTYASIAIANNADIKTVQELLGHASASVTLNVYSHAYHSKKREQADKLDDMLFSNCIMA